MTIRDHCHTPEAIAARLEEGPKIHYLREWVYGGIDGAVTTFAIVAAVIGANLSPLIVLIMGLANVVGDGFSMAAASYSGSKAEADNYERLREIEAAHIEKYPDGEREETRQILIAKGFHDDDLEQMVELISREKDQWIDFMITEEYGVSKPMQKPMAVAAHTFAAFLVCGCMPLLPYIFNMPVPGHATLGLSAITFFAIGSGKSHWSVKSWWREGLETMAIGLTAAGLAFAIGYGLKFIIE